jgi:hypothetical protein
VADLRVLFDVVLMPARNANECRVTACSNCIACGGAGHGTQQRELFIIVDGTTVTSVGTMAVRFVPIVVVLCPLYSDR